MDRNRRPFSFSTLRLRPKRCRLSPSGRTLEGGPSAATGDGLYLIDHAPIRNIAHGGHASYSGFRIVDLNNRMLTRVSVYYCTRWTSGAGPLPLRTLREKARSEVRIWGFVRCQRRKPDDGKCNTVRPDELLHSCCVVAPPVRDNDSPDVIFRAVFLIELLHLRCQASTVFTSIWRKVEIDNYALFCRRGVALLRGHRSWRSEKNRRKADQG